MSTPMYFIRNIVLIALNQEVTSIYTIVVNSGSSLMMPHRTIQSLDVTNLGTYRNIRGYSNVPAALFQVWIQPNFVANLQNLIFLQRYDVPRNRFWCNVLICNYLMCCGLYFTEESFDVHSLIYLFNRRHAFFVGCFRVCFQKIVVTLKSCPRCGLFYGRNKS